MFPGPHQETMRQCQEGPPAPIRAPSGYGPPRRRGRACAFSRAEITQAAIDLADREGIVAVSMRRVAARIGSAPTSLYWYFSNKSQLYELMMDAVVGEIELPERPSGDWRADLASIAWATRLMGRRHPWLAGLGVHPVPGPLTRRYGAAAFRSLEGLGLDPATEVNILAAVNNYVSGFLERETSRWTPKSWAVEATRGRPQAATGQPRRAETTPASHRSTSRPGPAWLATRASPSGSTVCSTGSPCTSPRLRVSARQEIEEAVGGASLAHLAESMTSEQAACTPRGLAGAR